MTPEEPSSRLDKSAAALGQAGGSLSFDNLNVIYDNDTTIVELTSTAAPKLPNNSACAGSDEAPLPARFNKTKMADFYDSDRTEAELLEQRDNFATCLLEPPLEGRLNFWQPVNNAGVLHALFRFRSTKPAHSISRRESFRAPIERAPHDGLVTLAPLGPRNKVWLSELDNCSDFERRSTKVNRKLLAEVSGNIEQPGAIDVDAELIVAHFNLTGTNAITERQLVIESAQGTMIACCRVIRSDRMPSSELDNLPSVSVVQPTREHLLPDKLRQTN